MKTFSAIASILIVMSTISMLACDKNQADKESTELAATTAADSNPDEAQAAGEASPLEASPLENGALACDGSKANDCPFHDEKQLVVAPVTKNAQGDTHFGQAFTLNNEAIPLADAIKDETIAPTKLIKVKGTITSVCKKKGCWMVISDGAARARVTMHRYSFFVPVNARGTAIVEGHLKPRVFTEAQIKHLEEDAGRDPSKVSGERREFVLTAKGIDITG